MATTRIMPLHAGKGRTVGKAIDLLEPGISAGLLLLDREHELGGGRLRSADYMV